MRPRIASKALLLAGVFAAAGPVRSQEPARPPDAGTARRADPEAAVRAEMELRRRQQLERLKASDPAAYAALQEDLRAQEEIQKILARAGSGALSPAAAKAALRPLVKSQMQSELAGLDERIGRLERRLADLKKAKKDPDSFVDQRVESMLGLSRQDLSPVW
ncbi:MAG: hypothetical protein HY552_01100 [Elusimicrobia bacterium]|nr:hypothetical protein [Elusimicrobiota bacterium]